MNNVVLIGRITAEPSLKQTSNGIAFLNFSLAVERRVKERTVDFIRCVAYKQTAEIISKYAHKGNNLGIQGAINVNSYEKDGEKRESYVVVVNQVDLLGGKMDSAKDESENVEAPKVEATASEAPKEAPKDEAEASLPFEL